MIEQLQQEIEVFRRDRYGLAVTHDLIGVAIDEERQRVEHHSVKHVRERVPVTDLL